MSITFTQIKNIVFVALTAVLLAIAIKFKDITLLFFGSYVIASAINPLVDWMSRKMPRGFAVTLIYTLGLGTLTLLMIPLIVTIYDEIVQLAKNFPSYISTIKCYVMGLQVMGEPVFKILNFDIIFPTATNIGTQILNQSLNLTKNIIFAVTIIFTIAILVLYMILDKAYLKNSFLKLFPSNMKDKAGEMASTISDKVGGYVVGQLLTMICVGIITGLGLAFFHVNYAALLGLIAGLLDIIPIVGPITAFIIGLIVAAPSGISAIFAVIFVYAFAQWVTNNFVRPILFGKLLDLHPLVIILSLFLAASTLGMAGLILAPAIAATVCVIFDEVYVKTINQKDD